MALFAIIRGGIAIAGFTKVFMLAAAAIGLFGTLAFGCKHYLNVLEQRGADRVQTQLLLDANEYMQERAEKQKTLAEQRLDLAQKYQDQAAVWKSKQKEALDHLTELQALDTNTLKQCPEDFDCIYKSE